MIGQQAHPRLRKLLEQDRLWTAYALADLDPIYSEGAEWLVNEEAAILHYQALQPPVLFIYGSSQAVGELMPQVPSGRVQFMVRPENRPRLMERLEPEFELDMWRMALNPEDFDPPSNSGCRRLMAEDLPALQQLIEGHPDRPDAFSQFQLEHGVFYGSWKGDRLIAVAGTHVLSRVMDVAAVGNVFTDPDYRGQGHGRAVSAAVVAELLEQELGTIVLNVAQKNEAALKIYHDLGFWPVCGYHEGIGSIIASH